MQVYCMHGIQVAGYLLLLKKSGPPTNYAFNNKITLIFFVIPYNYFVCIQKVFEKAEISYRSLACSLEGDGEFYA